MSRATANSALSDQLLFAAPDEDTIQAQPTVQSPLTCSSALQLGGWGTLLSPGDLPTPPIVMHNYDMICKGREHPGWPPSVNCFNRSNRRGKSCSAKIRANSYCQSLELTISCAQWKGIVHLKVGLHVRYETLVCRPQLLGFFKAGITMAFNELLFAHLQSHQRLSHTIFDLIIARYIQTWKWYSLLGV